MGVVAGVVLVCVALVYTLCASRRRAAAKKAKMEQLDITANDDESSSDYTDDRSGDHSDSVSGEPVTLDREYDEDAILFETYCQSHTTDEEVPGISMFYPISPEDFAVLQHNQFIQNVRQTREATL